MFINNGFEYLGNIEKDYAKELGKEIISNLDIENIFFEDKKILRSIKMS